MVRSPWQPAHSPRLVLDTPVCLPSQAHAEGNSQEAELGYLFPHRQHPPARGALASPPLCAALSLTLVSFQEHLCLPAPCILEAVLTLVLIFPPEMLRIGSWQAGPGETLQK